MKFILFILVLSLFSCASSKRSMAKKESSSKNVYSVEGDLTHSSSYCGGVHPSQEVEEEYHRQKPFSTTLYVRKGLFNNENEEIIDSVTTDLNGHFAIQLAPGNYVFLLPSQKSKSSLEDFKKMESQYLSVDNLCLQNWWKSGLFRVEVKDSAVSGLNHDFHQNCFIPVSIPCFDYSGPYPP